MNILQINSSARSQGAESTRIADAIVAKLVAARNDANVTRRDLAYSAQCRQTRPLAPRVADGIATQLPQRHRLTRHGGLPFRAKRHPSRQASTRHAAKRTVRPLRGVIQAWTRNDVGAANRTHIKAGKNGAENISTPGPRRLSNALISGGAFHHLRRPCRCFPARTGSEA